MLICKNVIYLIGVGISYVIFNYLVQTLINTWICLNAKPEDQEMGLGLNSSYLSISNACKPLIAGMIINSSAPTTYDHSL